MFRERLKDMTLELVGLAERRAVEHIRSFGKMLSQVGPEPAKPPSPVSEADRKNASLTRAHRDLKQATSNITYTRNKLSTEIEEKERTLREVEAEIAGHNSDGVPHSEAAEAVLQGRKAELTAELDLLRPEHTQAYDLAERMKAILLRLQAAQATRLRAQERAAQRATVQTALETAEGVLLQFPEVA